MNTNSLKRFATVARTLLMQGVRNRLRAVGFNDDGSVRVAPEAKGNSAIFDGQVINDSRFVARWNALRDRIASHGIKEVVEEAAYTWFNRLMAIRILEYNSLAPALLDYENPEIRIPRIVTDARAGKTPVLSDEDRTSLEAVIGDGRLSFEQFSILIRAYCENNPIIRKCFGGITDYTVLLLPADILAENGLIDLLNKAGGFIEPDDYRKPELIGWLYQFYISEKKDEVFAKKGGYDSNEIPAATQIFTPNWIVKYMVENTLGRIYLDNNPDSAISENWKYLVEPVEPTPDDAILRYETLEDLKCGDLSCGSGHILNEMFDLLYQLYAEDFYSPREAVEAILTKNMVGIDLDDRARQLAQFALLMKACQTDTAFADGHCMPRVYSMPEVDRYTWLDLKGHFNCAYQLEGPSGNVNKEIEAAFKLMENANVLGSIMKFEISDAARKYLNIAVQAYGAEAKYKESFARLIAAFRIILTLTDKYVVLCMNPPYMAPSKVKVLKDYCSKYYPSSKTDLFAVFMELSKDHLVASGKYGMINLPSWMFLSSFEDLRLDIINNMHIDSLIHMGRGIFGIDWGSVAFCITNKLESTEGIFFRLHKRNFQHIYYYHIQELFLKAMDNHAFKYNFDMYREDGEVAEDIEFNHSEEGQKLYYTLKQNQFKYIPAAPIAYWVSYQMSLSFDNNKILDYARPSKGMMPGSDNILMFWEPSFKNITFNTFTHEQSSIEECKWYPYYKGGGFRRWSGLGYYIVNYYHDGIDVKSGDRNPSIYFKDNINWSKISSGNFSARQGKQGALYDDAACQCHIYDPNNYNYILGLLNSKYAQECLSIISQTFNYISGDIAKIPVIIKSFDSISTLVSSCISISKEDWDAHETSWDFQTNPLLIQAKDMPMEAIVFNDDREEDMEILYPELARCDANLNERQTTVLLSPNSLKSLYIAYRQKWTLLFGQLLSNEEEINSKFIEIYGLQDELSPVVGYEDITILQQGEMTADGDDVDGTVLCWHPDVIIKQFISYAVGCMMGRYRLDRPGLAIAHPNPSPDEYAPYTVPQTGEQWWIDDDGIVPMMGDDCGFHDNAANRFTEFVRVALGNEYLTENMNFVRDALGKDVVDYFRSDFYTDHKKMYQNRPIYWMFSSNQKGKRAAFQCLVYMHRMNRFTPEHIRTNYLLPYIDHLAAREAELSARSSLSAKENKLLKQLRSDLDECRDYQLRLHEFADRQIEISLDDGVVKNYATFAPVLAQLK